MSFTQLAEAMFEVAKELLVPAPGRARDACPADFAISPPLKMMGMRQ